MTDPFENLTAQGVARREAILRQTLVAVRRRRRRRQALRGCVTGLAVVALAVVLVRLPRYPGGALPPDGSPIEVESARSAGPIVQIIAPDPNICARLSAPKLKPTWQTIDDDQLLAALDAAGQPAGLVRVAGQTLLMVHQ